MSGFVVLAHPAVLAGGFALAATIQYTLLRGKPFVERYGGEIYALLLLVPLAAVWADVRDEGGLGSLFAAREEHAAAGVALWVAAGVAIGIALFALELGVATVLRRRAAERPPAEERAARTLAQVSPLSYLSLSAATVVLEELIWRAYLVPFMADVWSVPLWLAIAGAAVAFGLNHAYFGVRGFAFKTFHGIVWGALFVVSGLVVVAIASHAAFALALWWRHRAVFARREQAEGRLRHA